MNRSEIRGRILDLVSESNSAPVFYSTNQIDDIINEGMEILSEEVHAIKRTAFFALKPGTQYYYTRGIANDMMIPYRMWLPSLNRKLVAIAPGDLDMQRERWARTTGIPNYWFSVSWDLIGLYPSTTAGGGLIHCDYLAWPRNLMDDSDEPEFLLADQDSLVLYGVYDAMVKEWDVEGGLAMFSQFIEKLQGAQERHGIAQMDARMFQSAKDGDNSFRSGVDR